MRSNNKPARRKGGGVCATPNCINVVATGWRYCERCLNLRPDIQFLRWNQTKIYRVIDLYVYFIRNIDTGNIKIGVSKSPEIRIKSLETGCDAELEILAVILCSDEPDLEKMIHKSYEEHRKIREWFYPNEPILDLLEMAKKGDSDAVIASVRKRYFESGKSPLSIGQPARRLGKKVAYIMP